MWFPGQSGEPFSAPKQVRVLIGREIQHFMASKQQQLFAKIVLHNKLLDPAQVERLLQEFSDPEEIIRKLVKSEKLAEKKGGQLLALYRKQIQKLPPDSQAHSLDALEPKQSEKAAKNAGSSNAQSLDALVEQALEEDDAEDEEENATDQLTEQTVEGESKPDMAHEVEEASEASSDGLPPLRVDLEHEAEAAIQIDDADEEDLPVLERDTESLSDAKQVATSQADYSGRVDHDAKELIHDILREARELKASDVHITAGLVPMVRQAGSLKQLDRPPLAPETTQGGLLAMVDAGRRAQFLETHDLDFCYDGGEALGRFRTNFLQEQSGMDGVFRLIDTQVPSFEQLGLPDQIKRFTEYAVGIVLITGPKGSGKTTTLAAMVDLLNETRNEHMILIEDPIEYVHKNKKCHINQREVGTHTKSFGNALRAALREAPDIIVVGEMRDLETTSLAITAAETGHLVLATLHTPDAIRTIGRVLDVFPPEEQGQIRAMLSESLRGIVSQQLIPNTAGDELELAVEILVNTSAIGNMIREDRTFQLRGMMQTGRKQGMTLLDDSLIALVRKGKISKQEACTRATEKEYVEKEVG